jgi:hypothetical protein
MQRNDHLLNRWDRAKNKWILPEFPAIHKWIQRLASAYSLGKMVERASMKRERIYFHRYSTSSVDFTTNHPMCRLILQKFP